MYVISLNYKAELTEIDRHLPAHLEWIEKHYSTGLFLVSGRKTPPTGGIIIARQIGRSALEEILAEDPFAKNKLAIYTITEFVPRMAAPALADVLNEVA